MGIDGYEIADQLAKQGSSHILTGHELALGISAKFAGGVISGWTSSKQVSIALYSWTKTG
jgi:hypothetical protein